MGLMLFSMLMFFTMIFATVHALRSEVGSKPKPARRFVVTR
ncbi:hypothetical protein C8J38_1011587 [Rhizobium sp. PP-WC-2G-219]|nr:hypothetical protein C8J38_1011587 [Rhizobium sp. PP-WC-2G-219]TCQ09666.1 hypothetical protein C8J34_10262 [Rhizobium sp. PP-F2F-G36]CZT35191.1 hypothetical protein GA0004734_00022030 [Rhizobium sp. 9140]